MSGSYLGPDPYDYANNKFVGLDLTFAIAELDKASTAAMATSTDAQHPIDNTAMPPMSDPASEALSQARETLGTHR